MNPVVVVISNYGSIISLDDEQSVRQICGTELLKSPETDKGQTQSRTIDIRTLGVTVLALLHEWTHWWDSMGTWLNRPVRESPRSYGAPGRVNNQVVIEPMS